MIQSLHTSKSAPWVAVACAVLTLAPPAFAGQTAGKKPNIIQRHPTATGVAAGVATRAALKKSAAAKKRRGQKLNFAERHPTMTGIVAGVATRTAIKRSTAKPVVKRVAPKKP